MITKRVVLSQTEVLQSGVLQLRLEKQIVEDGKVIAREPHRLIAEPGQDLDAIFDDGDQSLASLGYPEAEPESRSRAKRLATVEHTPEVVAAFGDFRVKRMAAEEARNGAQAAIAARSPNAQQLAKAALDLQAAADASFSNVLDRVNRKK